MWGLLHKLDALLKLKKIVYICIGLVAKLPYVLNVLVCESFSLALHWECFKFSSFLVSLLFCRLHPKKVLFYPLTIFFVPCRPCSWFIAWKYWRPMDELIFEQYKGALLCYNLPSFLRCISGCFSPGWFTVNSWACLNFQYYQIFHNSRNMFFEASRLYN